MRRPTTRDDRFHLLAATAAGTSVTVPRTTTRTPPPMQPASPAASTNGLGRRIAALQQGCGLTADGLRLCRLRHRHKQRDGPFQTFPPLALSRAGAGVQVGTLTGTNPGNTTRRSISGLLCCLQSGKSEFLRAKRHYGTVNAIGGRESARTVNRTAAAGSTRPPACRPTMQQIRP